MLNIAQKSSIRDYLRKEICTLEFIKKNGELRKMHCTLVPEYIPTTVEDSAQSSRTVNSDPNLVTVWDLEKQDWRAFKLDSVKSFAIDNSAFSVTF
jgi:hypothetical protein